MIARNKGKKLPVPVPEELNALCGMNASAVANEIGIQIRRMCPIQGIKSWSNVDEATKAAIIQVVRVCDLFTFFLFFLLIFQFFIDVLISYTMTIYRTNLILVRIMIAIH